MTDNENTQPADGEVPEQGASPEAEAADATTQNPEEQLEALLDDVANADQAEGWRCGFARRHEGVQLPEDVDGGKKGGVPGPSGGGSIRPGSA